MNVAIYLRVNQRKGNDENIAFWKEKALLYCKQRKYIPVVIMELSGFGATAEEYGLNKLEELFRKKYIAGVVTYDISMITQDMKKLIRFFDVLYGYNIRMDSINQGILGRNFIEKIINFSKHEIYGRQRPEARKNIKEQFPIGSRVKLERICSVRGSGLTMGDLGTVLGVSNPGILKIAWDILDGQSVHLHLNADVCQCIMRKEQIEKFLKDLHKVPFQSIQRLEDWITLVLEPAFPYVSIYRDKVKKVVFANLGAAAFGKERAILTIRYKTGKSSEIYVTRTKIEDEERKAGIWRKIKRK